MITLRIGKTLTALFLLLSAIPSFGQLNIGVKAGWNYNFPKSEDPVKSKRNLGGWRYTHHTNEYIDHWEDYFKKAAEKYKKLKNVEFADEFDHDFVLLTQEIEESLTAIEKPEIISEQIGTHESVIKLSVGCNLSFKLVRVDDRWKVNSIENLGLLR